MKISTVEMPHVLLLVQSSPAQSLNLQQYLLGSHTNPWGKP